MFETPKDTAIKEMTADTLHNDAITLDDRLNTLVSGAEKSVKSPYALLQQNHIEARQNIEELMHMPLHQIEHMSPGDLSNLMDRMQSALAYLGHQLERAAGINVEQHLVDVQRQLETIQKKLETEKVEEDQAAQKKKEEEEKELREAIQSTLCACQNAFYALEPPATWSLAMTETLALSQKSVGSLVSELDTVIAEENIKEQSQDKTAEETGTVTKTEFLQAAQELKAFKDDKQPTYGELDNAIKNTETVEQYAEQKVEQAERHGDHAGKRRWEGICNHCQESKEDLEAAREEAREKFRMENYERQQQWEARPDGTMRMRESSSGGTSDGEHDNEQGRAPSREIGQQSDGKFAGMAAAVITDLSKTTGLSEEYLKDRELNASLREERYQAQEQGQKTGIVQSQEPLPEVLQENNARAEISVSPEKANVFVGVAVAAGSLTDAVKRAIEIGGPNRGVDVDELSPGQRKEHALQQAKQEVAERTEETMRLTEGATPADINNARFAAEASVAMAPFKGQLDNIAASIGTGARAAFEEIGKMLESFNVTTDGQHMVSGMPEQAPGPTPNQPSPVQAQLNKFS